MTTSALFILVIVAVLGAALILVSVRVTGQVAERFGEDPRSWQLRMLPFTAFGPFLAWLILSNRHGGGPRGFA